MSDSTSIPEHLSAGLSGLAPDVRDHTVAALRAVLGVVPIAGPILSELVTATIPRQRLDRVAAFARELESRLASVEAAVVRSKLEDPAVVELVEEAIIQAARATSDERRRYLAELLSRSLTPSELEQSVSRNLLRLLGELNDIEVLWLRYHTGRDVEFRNRHLNIFRRPAPHTQEAAIQQGYKHHLVQLGLLVPRYELDRSTRQPKLEESGAPKVIGHNTTPFGELLLREIGYGREMPPNTGPQAGG